MHARLPAIMARRQAFKIVVIVPYLWVHRSLLDSLDFRRSEVLSDRSWIRENSDDPHPKSEFWRIQLRPRAHLSAEYPLRSRSKNSTTFREFSGVSIPCP